VVEEEHSLPPPKDIEAVSSPTFSGWSSSNDKSERKLEDAEDAATETLKILMSRMVGGGRVQGLGGGVRDARGVGGADKVLSSLRARKK
jgi:hypothetical protein